MNKLWTFGDSFIDSTVYTNNWVVQIANELNLKHCSFGTNGSSLDHMYSMINSKLIGAHENDVVIIALTEFSRTWLIKNRPELSSLVMICQKNNDTELVQFAEKYFVDHINEDLRHLYLKYFLTWLNLFSTRLKTKPIVFSSFKSTYDVVANDIMPYVDNCGLTIVNGGLWESVSLKEMSTNYIFGSNDMRYNHMTYENHVVLKNKVVDLIKNNTQIDISTGFATGGARIDREYIRPINNYVYE
jgi:hypothetical protein